MKTPIYQSVMQSLKASRGHWKDVADGSGISKRTIEKIASREISGPSVHSVQTLYDFFLIYNRKKPKRIPPPAEMPDFPA